MLLCDCCETKPAQLVCADCYHGAWCSRECQEQDMEDHYDNHCIHPNEMSDEHVLEEVDHQVTDPKEARELLMAHLGEELVGTATDRRRKRRLRRRRRKLGRKRRGLRRGRKRDAWDRRGVKTEQRRLRREDGRFERELNKNNLARNKDELIDPETDYDELAQ